MDKPEFPSYRHLNVVYCDDVRQETGNKLSLMGLYQADLVVPAMPTKLPKLCAVFTAKTPASLPFKHLKFELTKNEQVVASTEIPSEALEQLSRSPKPREEDDSKPTQWVLEIGVALQLTPFEINEPFKLRSRIQTESELIRGQSLTIKKSEPSPPRSGKALGH